MQKIILVANRITNQLVLNRLMDNSVGQGLQQLLRDTLTFIQWGGTIICIIFAVFYSSKSGMGDDAEGPANKKKAKNAGICAVLTLLIPAILKIVMGYFGVGIDV